MKKLHYIALIGILVISSCKKSDEKGTHDMSTKSEFTYGKYGLVKNALNQVIIGESCQLDLDQRGFHDDRAAVTIVIDNFDGVGTYDLADGEVTIYCDQNGEDMYWSSEHRPEDPTIPAYGVGKIEVQRCDDRFVAIGNCVLLHEENGIKTSTHLTFKTDQRILKHD